MLKLICYPYLCQVLFMLATLMVSNMSPQMHEFHHWLEWEGVEL